MDNSQNKIERIKMFRPIDDVFFEVLAKDIAFDQEMLRLILEDNELIVEDVIVQSDERNLYGRSVRLDALCVLGNGVRCNIEVQRSNNDDHFRRVRYNASMITTKDSCTGSDFSEIPEVYVVYISEFDFIGANKTAYHVEKIVKETGELVDDGLHEIFVNTVRHGSNTELEEYMSYFTKTEVNNPKYPAFDNAVRTIKNTEGGLKTMCEIMEKYTQDSNIDAAIQVLMDVNIDQERIINTIRERFNLTGGEASERVKSMLTLAKGRQKNLV